MGILTAQDLTLEDVLRNDDAMSAFMQFVDTEGRDIFFDLRQSEICVTFLFLPFLLTNLN